MAPTYISGGYAVPPFGGWARPTAAIAAALAALSEGGEA